MIAATTMLRPPPARISKISDKVTLPRSVSVKSLLGGMVGLFFGVVVYFLGVVFILGFNLEGLMLTLGGCATVGVVIVNYSPLKGENWATWFTLQTGSARGGKVRIDGQEVRAYIGIAPLNYSAAGKIRVASGTQEVLPGSVDDRGASLSAAQVRQNSIKRARAEQAARP
jgi:hypothetical protein